jgi:L,D-transpeptidase ErfK/SrfK
MADVRSWSLNVVAVAVAAVAVVHAQTSLSQLRLATTVVGQSFVYEARAGDNPVSLGARYGVDAVLLAGQNAVPRDARLQAGQPIAIDNRHIVPVALDPDSVVVNIPQRMLFFRSGTGDVEGYPVAVGRRSWQTPLGEFAVQTKERNPTWDVPPSILEESRRNGRVLLEHVPPGPTNPLGAFWLGLSLSSIGIHSTNAPSSIFRAATHGCIRVAPDDMVAIFERIPVGARGRVVYEPVLLAETGGRVFLEAQNDVYRRAPGNAADAVHALAETVGLTDRIDWALADAVVAAREGIARDVTR